MTETKWKPTPAQMERHKHNMEIINNFMDHYRRLKEANEYINYCLKHGSSWDEDMFLTMNDDEIIKFAEQAMSEAELQYDATKDDIEA